MDSSSSSSFRRSPFADGESLRGQLDTTAAALGRSAAALDETWPGQQKLEHIINECLEHTDHMEESLASTGPHAGALARDVLPALVANTRKLDALFGALDAFESVALPRVEAALARLEAAADRLEADKAALEPSSYSRVMSFFTGATAAPPEESSGGGRSPWVRPEVIGCATEVEPCGRGGLLPRASRAAALMGALLSTCVGFASLCLVLLVV